MKKLLLVGGSGILGKQIAEGLSNEFEILIFDRNKRTKFKTVKLDVLDRDKLFKEFKKHKFDSVIHLVGTPSINLSKTNFNDCFKLNIITLKNIIDCCKTIDTKLIFISSAAVYGRQKTPQSENMRPNPMNLYGFFKYFCEEMIIKNCKENGTGYTILRVFNVYSPEKSRLFIDKIFEAIENKTIMPVYGVNQLRDFIHIGDFISIVRRTINYKESDGQIVNVGSGKGYRIKDLVSLFKKYTNIKFKIVGDGYGYDSVADITKLKNIYRFSPMDILPELTGRLRKYGK